MGLVRLIVSSPHWLFCEMSLCGMSVRTLGSLLRLGFFWYWFSPLRGCGVWSFSSPLWRITFDRALFQRDLPLDCAAPGPRIHSRKREIVNHNVSDVINLSNEPRQDRPEKQSKLHAYTRSEGILSGI